MKRRLFVLACTIAVAALSQQVSVADAVVSETDSKASLGEGDSLGAFRVEKIAGAADDGVELGDVLCYRCRYGSRPMVLVFAKQDSQPLLEMVKRIDAIVEKHEAEKMRALVTFFGDGSPELKKMASAFAEHVGSTHVPIVTAMEAETGPLEYRLPIDEEVTVVVATDSRVVACTSKDASEIDLDAIEKEVESMLANQD